MNDKTSKNLKFLMKFYFNSKSEKKTNKNKRNWTSPTIDNGQLARLSPLQRTSRTDGLI